MCPSYKDNFPLICPHIISLSDAFRVVPAKKPPFFIVWNLNIPYIIHLFALFMQFRPGMQFLPLESLFCINCKKAGTDRCPRPPWAPLSRSPGPYSRGCPPPRRARLFGAVPLNHAEGLEVATLHAIPQGRGAHIAARPGEHPFQRRQPAAHLVRGQQQLLEQHTLPVGVLGGGAALPAVHAQPVQPAPPTGGPCPAGSGSAPPGSPRRAPPPAGGAGWRCTPPAPRVLPGRPPPRAGACS